MIFNEKVCIYTRDRADNSCPIVIVRVISPESFSPCWPSVSGPKKIVPAVLLFIRIRSEKIQLIAVTEVTKGSNNSSQILLLSDKEVESS